MKINFFRVGNGNMYRLCYVVIILSGFLLFTPLLTYAQKQGAYVGCFKEAVNDRTLDGCDGISAAMDVRNQTIAWCVDQCGRRGFSYAGWQVNWCFCGNNPNKHGRLNDSACNLKLDGEPSASAGGPDAISVYAVRGEPASPGRTPTSTQANQPPRAPTILSPTTASSDGNVWTAIPANPAGIFLRWRNNGDPDNDPLRFWIVIARWDGAKFEQVYAGYAPDTYANDGSMVFTMTSQHGLANRSYYHWYVFAVDANIRNQTVSQPGRFRTY